MLQSLFLCRFSCGRMFTSLDIYLGVELLSHMVTLTAELFSKVAASFTLPSVMYKCSNLATSLLALAIVLFVVVILVHMK